MACWAGCVLTGAGRDAAAVPGAQSSRLGIRFGDEGDGDAWRCRCGRVRQVTSGPGDDTEAAWSPDGKRIAFQTDRNGDLDLAAVDVSSGKVTSIVEGDGNACYPAWTPDSALVYAFGHHPGTAVQAATAQADWGYGLRLWRAGETRVLTQGYWRDYTPSVTPDGGAAVYASTRGETGDGVALWRVALTADAPGERLVRLEDGQGGMVQPSLSPDGRFLLWAQLDNFRQNWRLCAAFATNLQACVFLTPREMGAYAPRWSPDGRLIAFTGFREGEAGWGIYVTEPRSGAMSRLDTGEGVSRSPAWSPDGQELVFENNRTGSYKLYRTRVTCRGQSAVPGPAAEDEYRVEARLERRDGAAELVGADGARVAGVAAGGQDAVSFARPAGLDFGTNAFFARITLTVDGPQAGSRIAAVGHYAEHAMGWQVFVSEDQRVWFHARNPQGVFIGAVSDAPVAFGQPVDVLGVRYAGGEVRLYLDGEPQKQRGAGAVMAYGTALKVCLGQQWNGGMGLNGRVLSFECGRGYPEGVPHPMTRERLFRETER
jgi:TolB protein